MIPVSQIFVRGYIVIPFESSTNNLPIHVHYGCRKLCVTGHPDLEYQRHQLSQVFLVASARYLMQTFNCIAYSLFCFNGFFPILRTSLTDLIFQSLELWTKKLKGTVLYCCLQVLRECRPDGLISPQTCIYFKDWLTF
jgi:hypothetical protein